MGVFQGSSIVTSKTAVRRLSLGVGLALGVLLLALAFRGVDPSSLMAALAKTDPTLVILALATVAATMGAKAHRWGLLFYPSHRDLRFGRLLSALLIGQMMNSLLPARLGELARAYLIGETEGQHKLFALGTIVVEKLLDGLMLLLLLALLFLLMPLPDWLRIPGATTGLALAGLLAAILLLTGQRERILGAMDRLCQLVPFLERFGLRQRLAVLADGLSSLRATDVNTRLLAWSVGIWVLAALTNYLTLLALRIEAPLLLASLFVLVVIHIGLVIPSSPARIGVFHYLCVLSLSVFGVEGSLALAYGFVLHFIVVLPIIFVGLFFLWRENLSLYRLAGEVDDS
jgi:uncharacterized protein (TIRG00374 family)